MGCNMDFSKWRPKILHEIEYKMYLAFHNYFVSYGKVFFFFRNSHFRSDHFSLLIIVLFTSVVCYCQHGLRRKHGKCSLCNEWWHSFMNQRLNHLGLLYKKCNCIRIMSQNTCNKNVDIIWHYYIISQITLHVFWKRSDQLNLATTILEIINCWSFKCFIVC